MTTIKQSVEKSGHDVNYYLVTVANPKRLDPYVAECDDLIEALGLTFAEGNVFKSLWRSGTARMYGTLKGGHEHDVENVYDGQKIAHYGARIKAVREFQKDKRLKTEAVKGCAPTGFTLAGLQRPVPLPDVTTHLEDAGHAVQDLASLDHPTDKLDSAAVTSRPSGPEFFTNLSDSDNDKRTYGI